MEQKIIHSVTSALVDLVRLARDGNPRLWVDYDREADVMYISFGRPQKADDSIQGADDIISRKKSGKIIGLTILRVSRFAKN